MGDRDRYKDVRHKKAGNHIFEPPGFLVGGDLGEDGAGRLEIEVSQRGLTRT